MRAERVGAGEWRAGCRSRKRAGRSSKKEWVVCRVNEDFLNPTQKANSSSSTNSIFNTISVLVSTSTTLLAGIA